MQRVNHVLNLLSRWDYFSSLLKAKAPAPKHSAFKAYEPGYIHIDVKYLPQMADESRRRYLFVAIDLATRWVFIRIFNAKTAANARRFLRDLSRACPLRIRTILTDNGKEFTDRLFGLRKRAATGGHEFDTLCADLEVDHRLTPPKSPQTNGMVERFNGRVEDVLQSHHFRSGEELETTLHRYVWLYNQRLPQSALASKTPLQAMKDWYKLKPDLFMIVNERSKLTRLQHLILTRLSDGKAPRRTALI